MTDPSVPKKSYRSEIQGLRAIAVISVLIFHADVGLNGGFLGVDIFFVVSGFLVGGFLLEKRYSSFGEFWRRRFVRLFPAMSVLVLCTTLFFALFLWSEDNTGLPTLALAALLGFANVSIALNSGDYFSAGSESNPLLHIWSLSVEEQVYLVLPLLLLVLGGNGWRKPNGRGFFIKVTLVGIFSLLLFAFGTSEIRGVLGFGQGVFGFFSPLTRLWEFLAGLIAFTIISKRTVALERVQIPRWISLTVLFLLLIFSNGNSAISVVSHIGVVLATMMILLARKESASHGVLANGILKWIGDRSYSIYLWHWPFVVAAVTIWPNSAVAPTLATVVSIAPAVASFVFLEKPFMRSAGAPPNQTPRGSRVSLGIFSLCLIVIAPFSSLASQSADFRVLKGNNLRGDVADEGWWDFSQNSHEICEHPIVGFMVENDGTFRYCLRTGRSPSHQIVLIGDSHAGHYFNAVAERFPDQEVLMLTMTAAELDDSTALKAYRDSIFSSQALELVIVSFRWEGWEGTPNFENLFSKSARANGPPLIVFNGLPTFPFDPVQCKHGFGLFSVLPKCEFPTDEALHHRTGKRPSIDLEIQAKLSEFSRSYFFDTFSLICDGENCRMDKEGVVLYADENHLNLDGSRQILSNLPNGLFGVG